MKEALAHYVEPVYPRLAVAARVKGSVSLDLDVDDRGEVQNAVANGNKLLEDSARVAAMQWKFKLESRSVGNAHLSLQYGLGGKCE